MIAMKKILFAGALSLFLFACENKKEADKKEGNTTGENKEAKVGENTTPPPPMSDSAMMKIMQDYGTPGAMHALLAKHNGTWEAEVTQMMDPKAPPTKSKAVNVQTAELGGKHFVGRFSSTMMGMPLEGMSTTGYDNSLKQFYSTWVDNMGTGIVRMTGKYDEATKTINLSGKQTDPMTGKETDMREEFKLIDDNSYYMALYMPGPDGKEMKFMDGTFKKKK
jgi:hypothetical protein